MENALRFLDAGLSLIPLNGKRPLLEWEQYRKKRACSKQIKEWSKKYDCNFGIVTGELSGLTVIDADTQDAAAWVKINHKTPYKVKTKKGVHYYFKWAGETNQKLPHFPEKIDLRGEGGYVVAPGSIHESGAVYEEITAPEFCDFSSLPTIESPESIDFNYSRSNLKQILHKDIGEGSRNTSISSLAYRFAINEFSLDEALILCLSANNLLKQPLNQNEIVQIVNRKYKLKMEGRLKKEIVVNSFDEISINIKKEPAKQELPKPSGLLKDVQEYIYENSHLPQEAYSLAAALSFFSALSGNIYKWQGKSPNLYCFMVGESGTGKNDPQILIKRLLHGYRRQELLGLGKYASNVAFIDLLPEQRQRLDVIDEASAQFERMTSFAGQSYQKNILETLNELYTASLDYYAGERSKTSGTVGACWNPYVSILATTTPTGFNGFMSEELLAKGFTGRLLFLRGDKRPKLNKKAKDRPGLINKEKILELSNLRPEVKLDMPILKEIDTDDEVLHYWRGQQESHLEMINGLEDDNHRALLARKLEQAQKIAMIQAISRNPLEPFLDFEDLSFGMALADYSMQQLKSILNKNLAQNQVEAKVKKIRGIIEDSGKIRKRDLRRKAYWLTSRELDEILNTLCEAGEINKYLEKQKTGRTVEFYASNEVSN